MFGIYIHIFFIFTKQLNDAFMVDIMVLFQSELWMLKKGKGQKSERWTALSNAPVTLTHLIFYSCIY